MTKAFIWYLQFSNPFNSCEWLRQNFSLQYQYNIKQTSDKKREKYQLGDYKLIQYQILHTNIARIVWQTVRRITNEILGVKGLRQSHTFLNRSWGAARAPVRVWVKNVLQSSRVLFIPTSPDKKKSSDNQKYECYWAKNKMNNSKENSNHLIS